MEHADLHHDKGLDVETLKQVAMADFKEMHRHILQAGEEKHQSISAMQSLTEEIESLQDRLHFIQPDEADAILRERCQLDAWPEAY